MPILALDTCTERCSVALLNEGRLVAELGIKVQSGHAGTLLKIIDSLLEMAGCPSATIGLIAVGRGPGSFTGIRIGIATAKGLATALACPLKGICSLDAMVRAALPVEMPIMPVMDARKGEVFCALYSAEGVRQSPYLNIPPENIHDYISGPTLFLGNGLELYADLLARTLGPHFRPAPEALWYPKAAIIGIMASENPDQAEADVNPLYIRASDAALTLNKT
jgi:tRNA threonylcarbamoyladenosine biosynthesis protein TsaB